MYKIIRQTKPGKTNKIKIVKEPICAYRGKQIIVKKNAIKLLIERAIDWENERYSIGISSAVINQEIGPVAKLENNFKTIFCKN